MIYNGNMRNHDELPVSIFELTEPKWKGKIAMAYPLFGTAATHVASWYSVLGAERTERYLRDLKANDVMIVDCNAMSRDLVVQREVLLAFTDTDDANVAIQKGESVGMIFPDKNGLGTLLIPNTVALIKGGPNPEQGKMLIDYLLSKEVEGRLARSMSMQTPVREDVERPPHVPRFSEIRAMAVPYRDVADHLDESARFSRELFVH